MNNEARHVRRQRRFPAEGITGDFETGGMEGVAAKEEGSLQGGGPAGLDKVQVMILGWAVDFVPDYGMARVGEVDANLVHPPGLRECADEGEWPVRIAGRNAARPGTGCGRGRRRGGRIA